jgi:hypothetical protein
VRYWAERPNGETTPLVLDSCTQSPGTRPTGTGSSVLGAFDFHRSQIQDFHHIRLAHPAYGMTSAEMTGSR